MWLLRLRACSIVAEDLNSVLSPTAGSSQPPLFPTPGTCSQWPPQVPTHMCTKPTQIHAYNYSYTTYMFYYFHFRSYPWT